MSNRTSVHSTGIVAEHTALSHGFFPEGPGGLFLTPEEVEMLSGRSRPTAQARALAHMGIDCRKNAAGMILVLRQQVIETFGGYGHSKPKRRSPEPNWEALRTNAKTKKT